VSQKPSILKSIFVGLIVVITVLVFAYGFQVTKVNFKETRSETRLTQLTRIIRALAHPEIFEYEQEEAFIETPVYLPCPQGEIVIPEPDTSQPYLVLEPACAGPGEFILVSGHKFQPQSKGPINFIPPSGASLTIGNFEADEEGNFEERVQLPRRQPVDEAQTIRTIARLNVGLPKFSAVTKSTWEKIVETVFLALLATTFGTLIAIPLSFLSARNLMIDIKSTVTSISLTLIGWPIGIALALQLVRWVSQLSEVLIASPGLSLVCMIGCPVFAWAVARWALPPAEKDSPSIVLRLGRGLALIFAAASLILFFNLLGQLMFIAGEALMDVLALFSFIGYFIAQSGEMIRMIAPAAAALAGGAAVGSQMGKLGVTAAERLPVSTLRLVNLVLSALAGAMLFAILGAGIDWLYQIDDPLKTFWIPAAAGAILGGMLSLRYGSKNLVPTGSVVYMVMRTILNATRSIEPLIYVIVFVVWVGIGPFAGALALALHTIAALAKLYSEQVESISPGPLEAVTATGANRLQTIVYAVVPQIVPPYISFTIYRWDINVRMSTIIGFAGGGGVGFLLQQNIRLLDYRAAAVQMLAIAIVVATMDYTSALIRERFV
jgi:phosphonate ABC transporter permease subunit PhnE